MGGAAAYSATTPDRTGKHGRDFAASANPARLQKRFRGFPQRGNAIRSLT
jgi:hypothetical protein